jgi:hypothetical protein
MRKRGYIVKDISEIEAIDRLKVIIKNASFDSLTTDILRLWYIEEKVNDSVELSAELGVSIKYASYLRKKLLFDLFQYMLNFEEFNSNLNKGSRIGSRVPLDTRTYNVLSRAGYRYDKELEGMKYDTYVKLKNAGYKTWCNLKLYMDKLHINYIPDEVTIKEKNIEIEKDMKELQRSYENYLKVIENKQDCIVSIPTKKSFDNTTNSILRVSKWLNELTNRIEREL